MLNLFAALAAAIILSSSQAPTIESAAHTNQQHASTEKSAERRQPSPATQWSPEAADNRIADYTFWLTVLTGVLGAVGALQGFLIWRQTVLARDEFNATHRPRIICRDVDIIENGVAFILVNAGDAPGTIVESWIQTEFSAFEPRNLRSLGHNDLGTLTFDAGQIRDLTTSLDQKGFMAINFNDAFRLDDRYDGAKLFFLGTIVYVDATGRMRRSVFRRIWNDDGFRRSENPEHEYSD